MLSSLSLEIIDGIENFDMEGFSGDINDEMFQFFLRPTFILFFELELVVMLSFIY